MKQTLRQVWNEDEGILSFEWVLLITLLVIGIVSGVAGTRDAVIDELSDVAGAALCVDQGYTVVAVEDEEGNELAPGFSFNDTTPLFETGSRTTAPTGQTEP